MRKGKSVWFYFLPVSDKEFIPEIYLLLTIRQMGMRLHMIVPRPPSRQFVFPISRGGGGGGLVTTKVGLLHSFFKYSVCNCLKKIQPKQFQHFRGGGGGWGGGLSPQRSGYSIVSLSIVSVTVWKKYNRSSFSINIGEKLNKLNWVQWLKLPVSLF